MRKKSGESDLCTIKTSSDSQLHWKNHFHKNPIYLRIIADFEANNEIDNSSIGNEAIKIYKQNPVCNGYTIISELEDVLKSDAYESPLGYDIIDWFVIEAIKLESKMAFYFENTEKNLLTEEDIEDFINNTCRFCEKQIVSDKVRDRCHSTGKYKGPAHNTCNVNVTQQQGIIILFIFHNFSNYDCHMFFKRLVDLKNDNLEFEIFPRIHEEYISVSYCCFRFIDSYRFLSSSFDKLVKNLDNDDFVILKTEFPDKWQYLNRKLAYPSEYFLIVSMNIRNLLII